MSAPRWMSRASSRVAGWSAPAFWGAMFFAAIAAALVFSAAVSAALELMSWVFER